MHTPNLEVLPGQPDDAAIWIYTANRTLTPEECTAIQASLGRFLTTWTSHERQVVADAVFLFDRFLIVGAHIPGGDVSGCGIDKLVHAAEAAASEFELSWVNALNVVYRSPSGDIHSVPRAAFRKLVETSEVDADTHVFDTSVRTVGQLRAGRLETRAGTSWHGRVFALAAGVDA